MLAGSEVERHSPEPPFGIYAYTAREWDPEIGLYYYRARYDDPKIGRFLSEDPIKPSRGSLYPYVDNNPASLVDPLGLRAWSSNWGNWGMDPTAGFYVCCFQQQISVCRGPAYSRLTSPRVKMCAPQHEYIHVPRFREDCRYKNYCSGKPDGYPVYYKSKEHRDTMECEAWKATADCYKGEWGTYHKKKIKEYCGGP